MSSDTVWNITTPSVHAADPRRAPACTGYSLHLHHIGTSKVLAIASVLHIFRTKSALEVPTLKSTGYPIELSGFRQPKSTDTSRKYDLGTAETNAVLYTIDKYRRSKSTGNHIEVSGIRHPKSTDTSGKYDLGTTVTNARSCRLPITGATFEHGYPVYTQ